MKILMVNTRHFPGGGDSTYTFNTARLLARRGHTVAFFAMQDDRNLPDPNADLFVSSIDFRQLNSQKSLVTGVRVLTRTIYSREARRKFSQMLDRFQPDLIHLQNIHAHITPSVIFEARQRSLPMVWTLHDFRLVCPNSHFLVDNTGQVCEACLGKSCFQAVLRRCKKGSLLASSMAALETACHQWMGVTRQVNVLLAPSRFLKSKLLRGGFPAKQVRHLPLFLEEENFWEGQADQGYLLFLGRLAPLKGIYPLIEAARAAPEVSLVLAGQVDEPLASHLKTLLPPNVRYVGLMKGAELQNLLHGARALVLPSICYENQPLSILEAFAAGKPAIASDLGGMTELVAHEERGLLVPPGDFQELSAAMRRLSSDPALAQKMGQNAQAYACANHSPDQHYQALMDIYAQA